MVKKLSKEDAKKAKQREARQIFCANLSRVKREGRYLKTLVALFLATSGLFAGSIYYNGQVKDYEKRDYGEMPEYMKKVTALENLKSATFRREKTLTEKVTDYIPFVGSETDYNILPEVKRRANIEEIDKLKIVVEES